MPRPANRHPRPEPPLPRARVGRIGLALLAVLACAVVVAGPASATPAIDDKRAEVGALQTELARLDAKAGEAAAALNAAVDRLDRLRARLSRATRQLERALRDRERARRALAERLVALYREGRPSLVTFLLLSPSLSQAQAGADALRQISRGDAAVATELERQRARRAELRAMLARDRRRAATEVATAARQRRRVLALVARRREVLTTAEQQLQQLVAAEHRRLAAVARARARAAAARAAERARARRAAQQAAEQARSQAVAPPPASTGSPSPPVPQTTPSPSAASPPAPAIPGGSHVYPIVGASSFSDDWLVGRPGGRLHVGIDLFAARGAPVVAVADGTLFRVGYGGISGNRLWLRDGAGTEFFYAHLDSFAPVTSEGAQVRKGTVIGDNGDTGDARGTSPHVHFEIHPGGGDPIRPYPIVASWPRL